MATIIRMKSGSFRVQIRSKGLKLISKTFKTKTESKSYEYLIENQINSIKQAEEFKLPINIADLYASLHPDLKQAALELPIFSHIVNEISYSEYTLLQLIDDYMLHYNKKDKNIISRLKWWGEKLGSLPVTKITEDHVRFGISSLLREGTTGKRGVSPQTTNRFKANLSTVFEYGKDKYNLKHNPCRFIRSKPEGKGRQRYLTQDEQRRLLIAARNSTWDKLYLLILMAITTGARRSELMNLTYKDINWNDSTALCKNTKNGSDKILILTPNVMTELVKFRQVGNHLLFAGKSNSLSQYDFRNEWIVALQQARISYIDSSGERLVFHSLRHSFCSTLANTGAELHEIAGLAGHKSVQTTMRYIHQSKKRQREVLQHTFMNLVNEEG